MVLEQRSKSYLSSRLAIRWWVPNIVLKRFLHQGEIVETFSRFVSPANSKASGLHWPYSGWLKILIRFFLQSLPLIGLRVDRLDSAAACWRLRKQILFSFEFGKRQTTGLDFDFYSKKDGSSNSCFQTPKGDPTRKWWRRPLSKASYFCVWGITLIFLDYPHCTMHVRIHIQQKTRLTRKTQSKHFLS